MDYSNDKKELLLLKELLEKKEKQKNKILKKMENKELTQTELITSKLMNKHTNNNINNTTHNTTNNTINNTRNNIDDNNYFSGDDFSDNDDNELYCKIGQKKTICIYGLRNKLPISMRPDQWEKLYEFMMSGKLHKFIKENQQNLQ